MIIFFLFLLNLFFAGSIYCCQASCDIHINSLKKMCDNFHVVQHGAFYRSGQLRSNRLEKYIKKYGIKTIINLRGKNKNCSWWQVEKLITSRLGVKLYNISFSAQNLEHEDNVKKLLDIYKIATRPILVHCLNGADRTGEAAALWVLEEQHKTKKTALRQLSIKYGYLKFRHPKKYFLVKHWQGFENFKKNYQH